MVDFADVDTLAAGYQQRGGQPGLAYGIVVDGELVHAGGLGERHLGGPPPDAGTVFRIASMTKSFTASAILALRDDGALMLDDLAEDYVPELRDWPPVSPDAARISIRHLLTMTAGFPTDDPWGDRQQGLPLEEFAHLLANGVGFNWAPGTRFEYSNLGYAILGRVITAVTGVGYPDYVRRRLLIPAGHDAHRLRGGGVRGSRPADLGSRGRRPRLPALARRLVRGGVRPGWRVRPDGRDLQLRARPHPLGRRFRRRVPARGRRSRGRASGPARHPPGDAAAAGPHRLGHRVQPARGRGVFTPRHLRLRAVRRRTPDPGPDCQPQRRLPGVRQQHGLAPGHRDRRDSAG